MDYIEKTFQNRRQSAYLGADPEPEESAERLIRLFETTQEEPDEKNEKSDENKKQPVITQPTEPGPRALFDPMDTLQLVGLGLIAVLLVIAGIAIIVGGARLEV